ncbi:MAG: hypothetical protein ABIO05_09680 [Ferruginibacter sp.]
MKNSNQMVYLKQSVLFVLLAMCQAIVWAQDSTSSSVSTSTSTTTTSETWYTQPWVWIVGAAALLLLIVALVRGNNSGGDSTGRTDRVTVTKSVKTDTDI